MATTDKHPPLDPRRHSTNKRVKATTKPSFGVAVKTAKGSKKIKADDKNTTSAKRETAPKSRADLKTEKRVTESLAGENRTREKYNKLLKRGFITQNESMLLRKLRQSRKPVI